MASPWDDLPPARAAQPDEGASGWEDLPPKLSGRSWPVRLAVGAKIGLEGALANQARQLELAGVDAARGWHDRLAPTEEPEGMAGKLGAAVGMAAGLAPEFIGAGALSTVTTGTPIPGIVAAGAASGAAGAPEGERVRGALIGGGTALLLGGLGQWVRAAPWAVRALAGSGGGAGIAAGVDVAEGRPIDVENAVAQGLVFGSTAAAEPAFGALARARRARLEQIRRSDRARIGVPVEPPPGVDAGSQVKVSAPEIAPPAVPAVAAGATVAPRRAVEPEVAEPRPSAEMIDPRVAPVREVPVDRLSLSPEVPNFKTEARADSGVVPGKELGGKYERLGTAPIVAWERLDGRLEVITGRHRFELARRTQEPTIPTQVVREADGFTREAAQRFDAESNIRDGQGSTLDYARFFRGAREGAGRITQGDAEARGLLARAKGRAGWTLGNDASDGLYSLFGAGRINEAQALAIARTAPGDDGLQSVGARYALEGHPADYVANLMRAAKLAERTREGGGNLDLFGSDETAIITAERQARVATSVQRAIRERIASVSGAVKRPEAARELGVDVRDPQAVKAAVAGLRAELARWEVWHSDPDLVAFTRRALAEEGPAQRVKGKRVKPMPEPEALAPVVESALAPGLVAEVPAPVSVQPAAASASRVSEGTAGYGELVRGGASVPGAAGPPPVGDAAVDTVLASLRSREPIPGRAANLSLSAITSEADVQRALAGSAEAAGDFPQSVHRVPVDETLRRARDSGHSVEDIARIAIEAQKNPDAALRAGLLMRAAARDLISAAAQAERIPGAESHAALALAISRSQAIQSAYSGLGNSAGRLLNVFGQLRKIGEEHEATMKIVERAGGAENLAEVAKLLGSLESPEQVVVMAKSLLPQTRLGRARHYLGKTTDWIRTAWINGLVSGPHTHAVTMASNAVQSVATELEHALAVVPGVIRRAGPADRVTVTEMHARLASPVLDAFDGLRAMKAAFRTGESKFGDWAIDQIEMPLSRGLVERAASAGLTAPMRALMTESEFFRAMSYARELRGLATRKALGMGPATPEEFGQRVQSILSNPPENIVEAARQRALEVDAATALRGNLASLERVFRTAPGAWILVPFFRVTVNVGRQILMRTPVAPLMESVRAELAAGGARRDLAIARMGLGSGILLAGFLAARSKLITGFGPTDPAKRRVWLEEGNLPYSVAIGKHRIDLARLEPVGSLLGIAADYADVAEHASELEQNQIVSALTLGVVRNLANKTFVTNLHEALNGIYDPVRAGSGFVRRLAGSVVPAGVAEIARVQDPYLREAKSVVDSIRARIPRIEALGIEGRQGLPVRRGALGDPLIAQPGSVASRAVQAFTPAYRSTLTDDPAIRAMSGLGMGVGSPSVKVDGLAMTPDERDRFLEVSGRLARARIERGVQMPAFQKLTPEQREEWIRDAIRDGRKAARAELRLRRFRARSRGSAVTPSLEGIEPEESALPPDVTGIAQ